MLLIGQKDHVSWFLYPEEAVGAVLTTPAGIIIIEIIVHSPFFSCSYSKVIHMDFCGAVVGSICLACEWGNLSVPV